ncbi:hypothetical protein ACFQQB_29000 [Nonomuraea rubra]|uniref:hypothetical protein n=1 Tax=Nonomuraea rubra TaxID=46180 RepID=UPI003613196F
MGLEQATNAIMKEYVDISYGPWRVPVWASVGQYAGSLLLAIATWRSGLFGTARSLMLLLAGGTWMGVLKGASSPTPWSPACSAWRWFRWACGCCGAGCPPLPGVRRC